MWKSQVMAAEFMLLPIVLSCRCCANYSSLRVPAKLCITSLIPFLTLEEFIFISASLLDHVLSKKGATFFCSCLAPLWYLVIYTPLILSKEILKGQHHHRIFLPGQHVDGSAVWQKYLNFNNLPLEDRCAPDILSFKVVSDAVAKTSD